MIWAAYKLQSSPFGMSHRFLHNIGDCVDILSPSSIASWRGLKALREDTRGSIRLRTRASIGQASASRVLLLYLACLWRNSIMDRLDD